jgi:hypothetical protein
MAGCGAGGARAAINCGKAGTGRISNVTCRLLTEIRRQPPGREMEAVDKRTEAAMNLQIDREALGDAILSAGEPDGQYDAWTLDELDRLADLGSVRSAWAGTDDRGA